MDTSVLIITHNDADRLASVVGNLLPRFEKVFVIDNGSSDGTVQLGRTLAEASEGRLAFSGPECWKPDNGLGGLTRARNFGLRNIHTDWVFVMDCDETPEDPEAFKVTKHGEFPAYFVPWITRWGSGQSTVDYKLALFRRESGILFEGLFHEHPTTSARRLGLQCGLADGRIIHQPRKNELSSKRDRYVSNLKAALEVDPTSVRLNWFLGLSLYALGQIEASELSLSAAASAADTMHPVERANAALLLGYCLAFRGKTKLAEQWLGSAIFQCDKMRDDVEMVAYGPIQRRIGEIWHNREDMEQLAQLDPADLFYCGWPYWGVLGC
jgi:hypothetical protein